MWLRCRWDVLPLIVLFIHKGTLASSINSDTKSRTSTSSIFPIHKIKDATPLSTGGNQEETNDNISNILRKLELYMYEKKIQEQKHHKLKMPFVTLSYAQTFNGMIAKADSHQSASTATEEFKTSSNLPISCPESFQLTHALRSIHDGVLVGKNTMMIDNPRLNVRLWRTNGKLNHPRPLILDSNLKMLLKDLDNIEAKNDSEERYFMQHIRANKIIFCCNKDALIQFRKIFREKLKDLYSTLTMNNVEDSVIHLMEGDKHVTVLSCRDYVDGATDHRTLDLENVLQELYQKCGIKSLMVEGGSSILSSFASIATYANIVDYVCVTIAPSLIGNKIGLNAFQHSQLNMTTMKNVEYWTLGTDCIMVGQWPHS